jgi:ribosomal protein L32
MTGHDVTPARHEARWIENAVIGILTNCLKQRAPSLTTCPDCRALIATHLPCPICVEIRSRQYDRLHRKTA